MPACHSLLQSKVSSMYRCDVVGGRWRVTMSVYFVKIFTWLSNSALYIGMLVWSPI